MRHIQFPVLLRNVPERTVPSFVMLFALEAFVRALLASIVPLQLYAVLGSARVVSLAYAATSIAGLALILVIPSFLMLLKRRRVLTLGVVSYLISAVLFAQSSSAAVVLALLLLVVGSACLEVTINLYMMDHIPRRELNKFEPKRLFFAGIAFTLGPWLGVFLHENVAHNSSFLVAAVVSLVLVGYFWMLRLRDDPAVAQMKRAPPNPLRYLPRFFMQPRLVLAWVLAVARSGWWLMYFIYLPIYMTEAGYAPSSAAAAVSLGMAPLFLATIWGRVGEIVGLRRLLIASYAATGGFTILAGVFAATPVLSITFILLAAFAGTVIDAAGNIPYLRAVHPHERGEMTSVYTTYRNTASLLGPAIFAAVLLVLPLKYVFVAGGAIVLAMAWLCRYLPKRI